MFKEVPPTVVSRDKHNQETVTHPAFACISVSHRSGLAHLFGSDFRQSNTIVLTINSADLIRDRDTTTERHLSDKSLIEVEMTVDQWAMLLSAPNVADGVQCTLRRFEGKAVPGLPKPPPPSESFEADVRARMEKSLDSIDEAVRMIRDSGLSKVKAEAIVSKLTYARSNVSSNMGYVAGIFGEYMETMTQKARMKVAQTVDALLRGTGLKALREGGVAAQLPGLDVDDAANKKKG